MKEELELELVAILDQLDSIYSKDRALNKAEVQRKRKILELLATFTEDKLKEYRI